MEREHQESASDTALRPRGLVNSPSMTVLPPVSVSIIVVNYNGREKLLRCLASVRGSMPADGEVIVVDNASTDGSVEAVLATFADVTVVRSETNAGFSAGNNLGVHYAQGRFLVFLNPDTHVEGGWLEALLTPFETQRRIGLTTSKILLSDQPERINTCGNAIHLTGITLCRGMGFPRKAFGQFEEVDAVSGAAFAMRREVFEALGGFDDDFFLYMEDTDLSWRARLAGWRCVYVPTSVVLHDYALRIAPRKMFYQERNRYLMLLKNLKWSSLMLLLPALLLAEVIAWGFVLWRDRAHLGNKVQAYRWVLANWPTIMLKREATQRLRQVSDRQLLRHADFRLAYDQAAQGVVVPLVRFISDGLFFALRTVVLALAWR